MCRRLQGLNGFSCSLQWAAGGSVNIQSMDVNADIYCYIFAQKHQYFDKGWRIYCPSYQKQLIQVIRFFTPPSVLFAKHSRCPQQHFFPSRTAAFVCRGLWVVLMVRGESYQVHNMCDYSTGEERGSVLYSRSLVLMLQAEAGTHSDTCSNSR